MTRLTLFLALALSANAATQFTILIEPPWIGTSYWSQAASTIHPTFWTDSNAKLTLGTNALTSSAFLKIENRLDGDEGNSPFAIFTRDGIELSRIDTNGVFQMAGGNPEITTTRVVWVDDSGDDSNDGSITFPLRTVPFAASLANGIDGHVVMIGDTFNSNNVAIILTNNVSLIGIGPARSIVASTNHSGLGEVVSLSGTNIHIKGLSIIALDYGPTDDIVRVPLGGRAGIPFSGSCEQVLFRGNTDNVVINASETNTFTWDQCSFNGKLDLLLILEGGQGNKYYVNRCLFTGNGPNDTNVPFSTAAIRMGGTTLFVNQCVLAVTNNAPTNSGAHGLASVYDSGTRVFIDNTTISTTSPTNAYDIKADHGIWLVRNSSSNLKKTTGTISYQDQTWRLDAGSGVLSPQPTNGTVAVQLALSNNIPTISLQRPTGGGWQFTVNASDNFSFNEVSPSGIPTGRFSILTNGTAQLVDRNNSSSGIAFRALANAAMGNIALFAVTTNGNAAVQNTVHSTNGVASYASAGAAPTSITVGASPFSWTNTSGMNVVVYADGVSVTGTQGINGGTVFNTIGQNTVVLGPADYTTITYTIGTPTATWRKF